jgi:hypothetical protein
MKTIIAGSRTITDISILYRVIKCLDWKISEIISGGAKGVDMLGEQFAFEYSIPVKRFPANWTKFGLSAGMIRNAEMAMYSQALVAIWDGYSKGTANMIDLARAKGLKIYIEMV